MKKINLSKTSQLKIILTIIFITMLALNILTPLLADDFSYSFGRDGKIKNIFDVFTYQYWHYFNWGGRTIAHTLAQTFLLFPKWVFGIFNALIYTGMVYLMYLHAKGKKEDNPIMLVIIHLLIWFLLPVFGETFLWLIGSCNYLWTTFIILLFLLPFRNNFQKDNIGIIIGMFLLGIISGWTNENSAVGLLTIGIGLLVLNKLIDKKYKLKKWHISGLLGALIGFIVMIIAPGNFVRKASLDSDSFFIVEWIKRIIEYTYNVVDFLLPLIIIIVIAISIKIYKKRKIEKESFIYILGSFFSIYSMVLSPQFPARAWTGVFIFLIIGTVLLLFDLERINKIYKIVLIDFVIVFGIVFVKEALQAAVDINKLRTTWEYREEYIAKEKKKDNLDIVLPEYTTINSKNPGYGLSDISDDKKHWANIAIANYYEINSIQKEKPEENNED